MQRITSDKPRFTGLLQKPIDLDDAEPGWLKTTFAVPRDEKDLRAHFRAELNKRLRALDKFFKLNSKSASIWEHRAKAIIARELGIKASTDEWWVHFSWHLMQKFVPGFRVKEVNRKKVGRSRIWSDERLAQLFADVEFQKRKTGKRASRICEKLGTKIEYEKRWQSFKGATLRKAYSDAKNRRKELTFELLLCGPGAVFSGKSIDRIGAAIEIHALKI